MNDTPLPSVFDPTPPPGQQVSVAEAPNGRKKRGPRRTTKPATPKAAKPPKKAKRGRPRKIQHTLDQVFAAPKVARGRPKLSEAAGSPVALLAILNLGTAEQDVLRELARMPEASRNRILEALKAFA